MSEQGQVVLEIKAKDRPRAVRLVVDDVEYYPPVVVAPGEALTVYLSRKAGAERGEDREEG